MALRLYNTLGRKVETFRPLRGKAVLLYTCGPTVYKSQHIGNYRTFIFEDILKRVLLLNKFRVKHIMNITDVGHLVSDADKGEDKIAKAARKENKTAKEIARFYENEFKEDLSLLNILAPTRFIRATEHIEEQIKLIQKLEQKGLTYKTQDGIYFDTSRIKDYGKLAAKNTTGLRAGARVARGEKRHPTDFALWKFSPTAGTAQKRQMEWTSPWGVGFPGWHIECSAMSMKYLGPTLDIHCGGIDHIQVHHSCEIAQSEAATGKPFARFWMHGAFLQVGEKKMAKSSPETNITLATLREHGFDPLDFRYLALGTHYRKPLSFSWKALDGARTARARIASFIAVKSAAKNEVALQRSMLTAFNNDLNTPKALAVFWQAARGGISKSLALWADHIFGLRIFDEIKSKMQEAIPATVFALANKREMLRKEKKWQEADKIRAKIKELGFEIRDVKSGPKIHKI